ncbi:iron-siderophore ABC transporter substrate-binding protein [Chelativorans sp. M5D2P16]|uniref:iron-siderophore ABC transporter substrate-binding protein n=1 Tax=Chelativorans sp. M5D2P16 TaxID=3095678 RepID=UPI002ACABDED|nr:iron-siderophore ABC transporter substrate-binding protein [Chelativorans sp. M5D2P16]MDZ5699737.1 iron-siderophore ABC transporter substrate-binding protein [Chelativorans sp. M5D2P16]
MRPSLLTRRTFMGLSAGAVLAAGSAAAAQTRVAAIDWAMLETALALGILPVAATELVQYRKIVVEPPVPETTADIGLRGTPNYEMLRLAEPDLILSSNFYVAQHASLERIAPVVSAPVYQPGSPAYELAEGAARAIGSATGLERQAKDLIGQSAATLRNSAKLLEPLTDRPTFAISVGDARHFRAFGPDSMIGGVLERLGFENAWHADTSYSAAAPVGFEALAEVPEARVIIVEPIPPDAGPGLLENALWRALPMVREGRVVTIAPVNHFGGLPSAMRFSRLLADAMDGQAGEGRG